MQQKVKLDYDSSKSRFIITCPPWLNTLPQSVPNRKFDSKRKAWVAPAIRANIEFFHKKFTDLVADITKDADNAIRDAIRSYEDKTKLAKDQSAKFPAWYAFKTAPRSKQTEALNKIFGLRAFALFMDMRTGKTKTVIDWACAMRMVGDLEQMVIVCPTPIRRNWVRELAVHAPFPIDAHILDTSKPKLFDKWILQKHDFKWLIVGVEGLAQGSAKKYVERFLLTGVRCGMVVDESTKIKNHKATRSEEVVRLGKMAEYRGIMTGTPTAKGPLDLFMQFEFLDPDILGTGDYYSFRNKYAIMGGFGGKEVVGYQNLEELLELIEPFVYQARQWEVIDIPDKVAIRREVQMNPEQKRLYAQMKKEKRIETGDESLITKNVLEQCLRLQEITAGIATYAIPDPEPGAPKFRRELIPGNNPKIEELIACAEEYPGPSIVWAVYKPELELVAQRLREEFGEEQVVELHGGISDKQRDINVNDLFQGRKARWLVANAATGGMGLTMSVAENEFYLSNSYNYIDRKQSEERATGPDKKVGVNIVDIVCEGTVDDIICDALDSKHDLAEYIRNSIQELKSQLYN